MRPASPNVAAITPPSNTPSTDPTDAEAKNAASTAPRSRDGKWLAITAAPTEP